MYILWLAVFILFIIFIRLLYTRYAPVLGVRCIETHQHSKKENIILDIRDYQEAASEEIEDALVIPIAYLRRYYKEIPAGSLTIVASSHLEKNLAIRFLKSKGFEINGYHLTTCKCRDKIENYI